MFQGLVSWNNLGHEKRIIEINENDYSPSLAVKRCCSKCSRVVKGGRREEMKGRL